MVVNHSVYFHCVQVGHSGMWPIWHLAADVPEPQKLSKWAFVRGPFESLPEFTRSALRIEFSDAVSLQMA